MKKYCLWAVAALMLLSGCAEYSQDYSGMIETSISEALSLPASSPSYSKPYYSYYAEPSVGRLNSNQTSNTFLIDGSQVIMNLDVSSIVNSVYYKDQTKSSLNLNQEDLVFHQEGTYTDYTDAELTYTLDIYQVSQSYFILLQTPYTDFYSVSSRLGSAGVTKEIFKIVRTVKVKQDTVVAAYSSRQTISNTKEKLELFQNIAPENGEIEELFLDHTTSDEETGSSGNSGGNYATDNYPDSGTQATEEPTEETAEEATAETTAEATAETDAGNTEATPAS